MLRGGPYGSKLSSLNPRSPNLYAIYDVLQEPSTQITAPTPRPVAKSFVKSGRPPASGSVPRYQRVKPPIASHAVGVNETLVVSVGFTAPASPRSVGNAGSGRLFIMTQ